MHVQSSENECYIPKQVNTVIHLYNGRHATRLVGLRDAHRLEIPVLPDPDARLVGGVEVSLIAGRGQPPGVATFRMTVGNIALTRPWAIQAARRLKLPPEIDLPCHEALVADVGWPGPVPSAPNTSAQST